ncbi:MAG: ATP-binding cassette domain-containing protein [Ruminococcus sp.]|jgi:ABC-type sugar transport system ATPase subunit
MKKELLRIENGMLFQNKYAILYSVFIRIFYGDIIGITSDRSYAIEYLLKIMCGQLKFDSGLIYYNGKKVSNGGSTDAVKPDYVLINSNSSFIKTLSLAENVFALKERTSLFFHRKESEFALRKSLDEFDISLSVDTPVQKLNVIQRIQIEMIKAGIHGKHLFVMDMRNLYLSMTEKRELYQFLDMFRKKEECSIVIFDNQPDQISNLVEKIILLTDGKVLIEIDKSESRFEAIEKNFSASWDKLDSFDKNDTYAGAKEVLCFSEVSTAHIDCLKLMVRAGEVVTISSDCFKVIKDLEMLLKGELKPQKGEIYVGGKKYRPRKKHQILRRFSMAFIESPVQNQLIPNLSLYDNLCISRGLQLKGFWYDRSLKNSIQDYVEKYMGSDCMTKAVPEMTLAEKQRLIYLRWLLCSPDLVVCVEPFKSVDIYLEKAAVDMILEMSRKGIAVIILTHNGKLDYNPNSSG